MFFPQDLLSAVEECFKSLPVSEANTLAQKWVGPGDEFMNSDFINDPILLTKYNAMVHKAQQLKKAKVCSYLSWFSRHDKMCVFYSTYKVY